MKTLKKLVALLLSAGIFSAMPTALVSSESLHQSTPQTNEIIMPKYASSLNFEIRQLPEKTHYALGEENVDLKGGLVSIYGVGVNGESFCYNNIPMTSSMFTTDNAGLIQASVTGVGGECTIPLYFGYLKNEFQVTIDAPSVTTVQTNDVESNTLPTTESTCVLSTTTPEAKDKPLRNCSMILVNHPNKTVYLPGETLDLTGCTVCVMGTASDGSDYLEKDVAVSEYPQIYQVDADEFNHALEMGFGGEYPVYISYGNTSVCVMLTIDAPAATTTTPDPDAPMETITTKGQKYILSSGVMTVKTKPDKLVYTPGEELDLTGGTLTITGTKYDGTTVYLDELPMNMQDVVVDQYQVSSDIDAEGRKEKFRVNLFLCGLSTFFYYTVLDTSVTTEYPAETVPTTTIAGSTEIGFTSTTTTRATTTIFQTTTGYPSNFGTGTIGVPQEGEYYALMIGRMDKQIYHIGKQVTRFDPYITFGHYLDGEIVDTGMCPSSWVEDIVIDARDFDAFHTGEYEIRVIYHDAVATYTVRVVVDDQYIAGDIDNNGEVDITDVIMLGRYMNENSAFLLPDEGLGNVDMDDSGTLDAIDMDMLVKHIARVNVVQESDKSFTYETKTAYDDTKYADMSQDTEEETEQAVAKLHQLLADGMLAEGRAENIPERMEHTAYDEYLWGIDTPFLTRIRFGEVQTLDYMKAGNDFAYQIENVKEAMMVSVADTNTYQYDIYVRQADSKAFVWLGRVLDNSPNE